MNDLSFDFRQLLKNPGFTIESLLTLLPGIGANLAASIARTRVMRNLRYGVTTTHPPTLAGMACLMVSGALLACWISARRATHVDPAAALTSE